jgi:hypothetical protein
MTTLMHAEARGLTSGIEHMATRSCIRNQNTLVRIGMAKNPTSSQIDCYWSPTLLYIWRLG